MSEIVQRLHEAADGFCECHDVENMSLCADAAMRIDADATTIETLIRDLDEATARAERAEAALRRIASTYDESYPVGCQERRIGDLARAALAPAAHEQEKRDAD
jgi:hypothetical protein